MVISYLLRKRKERELFRESPYIKERSNIIQYDDMGYPLRLVINKYNEQVWIDTVERVGDLVLTWEPVITKKYNEKNGL